MFNVGSTELLIILLLVFLLFGPKHIPDVARTLGRGLGDIQRALRGVEDGVRRAAQDLPRIEPPAGPVSPVPGRGMTAVENPTPSAAVAPEAAAGTGADSRPDDSAYGRGEAIASETDAPLANPRDGA